MNKTYYAILNRDGELKRHRNSKKETGSLYSSKTEAIRQAKSDGDSVVPLIFDNSLQPVFIRSKTIDPDKDKQL